MTRPGADEGKTVRDRAATQRARGTVTETCPVCGTRVGVFSSMIVRHRDPWSDEWCAGQGRYPLSAGSLEPVDGDDEVSAKRRGHYARAVILPRVLRLVEVVREEHRLGIGEFLAGFGADELRAMCVVLAALVPEDRSADELLSWVTFEDDGRAQSRPGGGRERVAA